LVLRPFQCEDLDLFADLFVNEGFIRFSSGPFSRERVAEFVNKVIGWDRDGLPSQFVVTVRGSRTPIGYCGFFHQQVDDIAEIEIGYRLHPDSWNNGFATEAARAVRDTGFSKWKLDRLISLIHPENAASQRVAKKNGMILEKETTFKGFPAQVFAIGRPQWLALRGV
jgi:RimJ/RimL family protein N-acetyltransferase